MSNQIKIAMSGCGTLAINYYKPVINALAERYGIMVVAAYDANIDRAKHFASMWPSATAVGTLTELIASTPDLVIVASPPRFHAEQSISLLKAGIAVLCEKPMAGSLEDCLQMERIAQEGGALLAVGHCRRFLPSSRLIKNLIASDSLGTVLSYSWWEGGLFNWPAASPSFFKRSETPGGVLLDVGAHCLDLLVWWLGEASVISYEDDAFGGLETNARCQFRHVSGVEGEVRLSRDTVIKNGLFIQFEHGWVRCVGASADAVSMGFSGCELGLQATLGKVSWLHGQPLLQPADTYAQSFIAQLENVILAVQGRASLVAPASSGVANLRLIDACYAQRNPMNLEWMPEWQGRAL